MTVHTPSCLRCQVRRPGAENRLVLFPHAGGSAAFFNGWAENLPGTEVYAVCYPGRAERIDEPPPTDLRTLAWHVAAAVAPLADRPLVLFGHSMGALVALETARFLEARGARLAGLFASGTRAAQGGEAQAARLHVESSDDELMTHLVAIGGTDAALARDPAFRELVLPYVRGDGRMLRDHVFTVTPRLDCAVTTIVGEQDADADPRPWPAVTSGPFLERRVPGDHFYLVSSPPFQLLLDALNTATDR